MSGMFLATVSRYSGAEPTGDAVHTSGDIGIYGLDLVLFVLHRIRQKDIVAEALRLVDDYRRERREEGVVDVGNRKTDGVGLVCPETLSNQIGHIVAGLRHFRDVINGLLAYPVLRAFSGKDSRHGGYGKTGLFGY